MSKTHIFVQCVIERGGFSSERTFTVNTKEGQYTGTSDIEHLRDNNLEPISEDNPPPGQRTKGYVRCRIIRSLVDKHELLVDIPSRAVEVNISELVKSELVEA